MKVKRNWTVKQEQNAILKWTFREQNRNEKGGKKKGEEEDREGEIKTLQQKFFKNKNRMEGWQDKVEEGSQMVEQKDKGRENRREEII